MWSANYKIDLDQAVSLSLKEDWWDDMQGTTLLLYILSLSSTIHFGVFFSLQFIKYVWNLCNSPEMNPFLKVIMWAVVVSKTHLSYENRDG